MGPNPLQTPVAATEPQPVPGSNVTKPEPGAVPLKNNNEVSEGMQSIGRYLIGVCQQHGLIHTAPLAE